MRALIIFKINGKYIPDNEFRKNWAIVTALNYT